MHEAVATTLVAKDHALLELERLPVVTIQLGQPAFALRPQPLVGGGELVGDDLQGVLGEGLVLMKLVVGGRKDAEERRQRRIGGEAGRQMPLYLACEQALHDDYQADSPIRVSTSVWLWSSQGTSSPAGATSP